MSEPGAPKPPPRIKRNLFEAILMIVVGVILLLPGVCSGVVMVGTLSSLGSGAAALLPFWLFGFAVSAGGVALIVSAIRGRNP